MNRPTVSIGSDEETRFPWDLAQEWRYAHGEPTTQATIKSLPEDFFVDEVLKQDPTGCGEHLWLRIEKCGANTEWVAQQLARWAGVSGRSVSYAGMKDRHALTRQSFSIHLPGKDDPDVASLEAYTQGEFRSLELKRSARKLQRGALAANQFRIRLRDFSGDTAALAERISIIEQQGVPNYFGAQRFGFDNLERAVKQLVIARRLPRQRQRRALYLSTLRSYLFNRILSQRVQENTWNRVLHGDWLVLTGSRSGFVAEQDTLHELQCRCDEHDLSPSGPLVGSGAALVTQDTAHLEDTCLEAFSDWRECLSEFGVEQQRRSLRLKPLALKLSTIEGDPVLELQLEAGAFATVVLREITEINDTSKKAIAGVSINHLNE